MIISDRARPTSWAAAALLARVYLYAGKYDSAESLAASIIGNMSQYSLCSLDSVFLANSSEAIWQIMPPVTVGYTQEGSLFNITKSPTSGGATSTISTQLLGAFEPGDQRKSHWIGVFKNGTNSFYFPYKYKKGSGASAPASEYSMILRLAEQYLIRAESRAQQNNLTGAISDLNMIRARAGFGPNSLTNTLSQAQVLAAIAHERQVELFTEGHRWFDLKRTQTVNAVMSVVTQQKGGTWDKNQQLYPIPLSDIQNNRNLAQNIGY
jgi:hypothetical protein